MVEIYLKLQKNRRMKAYDYTSLYTTIKTKSYTVGAKSMSPVDIELFVIICNITMPLCITTQIFFLWELSNLNK